MTCAEADLIANAYVSLLRLPAGIARMHLDKTLAALREELARFEGKDSEYIQTKFEKAAELFKQERLGIEFEKVLFANIWQLYAR